MPVLNAEGPRLQALQSLAIDSLAAQGYALLDSFAERHGSWEMTAYRSEQDLDRYVVLSYTDFEDHGQIHVIAGAGNGRRFRRLDQGSIRVLPEGGFHDDQAADSPTSD